jgi:hypothetical protein
MNTILPSGISRLNTASSKFNLDSGSVLIGLNAGLQLQEIDNVFVGNSAGAKGTFLSESILIGMYAGDDIVTGKKNIIIGDDKSAVYLDKNNIISIGFNNVENNSIAIGSNISCIGSNNILQGRNIVSESVNAFAYGKNLNIRNSEYFADSMVTANSSTLLEGFEKIGLLDIYTYTNINNSNLFYIRYDLNNYLKHPNSMFNLETDIVFHFKPTSGQNFNFNLGFYINETRLINFNFQNQEIKYTNKEFIFDVTETISLVNNNPIKYNQYNTIHIINNDKNYRKLSLYINPYYNGHKINTDLSINYANDIYSIQDININNIRLEYILNDNYNKINTDYINSDKYNSLYPTYDIDGNIYTSNNIRLDYTTFNNSSKYLTFQDFIISINDVINEKYNIAYGKLLNVKGTNNILIGNYQNTNGDNSIFIGNDISTNTVYNNSKQSIVIGNSNFMNNYTKSSIVIGNNNYNISNNHSDYYNFLQKKPIIIGSDMNDLENSINIGNTLIKYDNNNADLFVIKNSKYQNHLPIALGYTSHNDVPIKSMYTLQAISNVVIEYIQSNYVSNYSVNGILYTEQKTATISSERTDVQILNNIDLYDDIYALYIKNGIYADNITYYNSSNYHVQLKSNPSSTENLIYSLPTLLPPIDYSGKAIYLSYRQSADSNELYWKTFENTFKTFELQSKNISTSGYIYSSNYIGIGSNLKDLNLSDRTTSLLAEGSNLYYTSERVGVIAHASNIIAMEYTQQTSNLISTRLDTIKTTNVPEGVNKYYTDLRFDERLLTKTLDNIYNGTSNKFITNDIYTNNLLITGTLTVGKIQVLGIDFPKNANNIKFATTDEILLLRDEIQNLSQIIIALTNRIVALET